MELLFPEGLTCPFCGEETGFCDCAQRTARCGDRLCSCCGQDIDASYEEYAVYGYRCRDCQQSFHYFKAHRSCYYYEGGVRKALQDLKYHDALYLAPLFGAELRDRYLSLTQGDRRDRAYDGVDFVAFVPSSPLRYLRRGYNQAEELAREMARPLGLPVRAVLRRVRATRKLNRLKKDDRKKELENAIMVKKKFSAAIAGKKILVIDDIYTTGATLDAAAGALYRAGASEIVALTAARGRDGTAQL